MINKSLVTFLFFLFLCNVISAQKILRIELESTPVSHSNDSLFLVGSFNGWNPGLPLYKFRKDANGKEFVELKGVPKGIIEYKITRGNWNKVECNTNGTPMLNRILKLVNDTIVHVNVGGWVDDFPARPPITTKSKQVFVIDTAFFIPQLNRSRRIWIYLPEDYALSKKRFPVLYLHDGQNLFDVLTAPFGEWGVDEMMDSIRVSKQSIIVGIDHGGNTRLTEYNPFNSRFGKGEGDAYVEFLVNTLKPYIDSVYKTKPSKENTMIAGSSMGGLISMYAALKHPDKFGAAGIFSPAFWIAPELLTYIKQSKPSTYSAFYFVCGELESEKMVSDMLDVYNEVKKTGNKKLLFKTVTNGRHHESFWKQEIYDCYWWLLKNQTK